MIPESFTSSDIEDDVKHESTPVVESDATLENNETLRAWFQRITHMQNEIQKKLQTEATAFNACAPPVGEMQTQVSLPRGRSPQVPPLVQTQPHFHPAHAQSMQTVQQSTRVVKYQDLPYMGEMTLDNSKPRRGRKPKKADICHLIYKNYGTIFPGTPNPKSLTEKHSEKSGKNANVNHNVFANDDSLQRSDVQNRIISSLLEKRLTQESKRQAQGGTSLTVNKKLKPSHGTAEPLNLCIRDLDHLKIRLGGINKQLNNKNNSAQGSVNREVAGVSKTAQSPPPKVEIKEERPDSDDEVEFVHETPSPASATSTTSEFKFPGNLSELLPTGSTAILPATENGAPPGGYVYWPNAGVFIHPLALQQQLLYYQKMTGLTEDGVASSSYPEVPKKSKTPKSKASSTKSETSEDESSKDSKRGSAACSYDKSPAKRKRSAIFIPPIPTENQSNPATEVSICKFKFTGGAKPSLQEKKMLSVDSGGNFRYYSGTGDKSMRGYEFFPRETLQQQVHNSQGSSTGAFLQASGERIYPSSPVDFPAKVNEFMLTPEIKPDLPPLHPTVSPSSSDARNKKRKSRKSIQREKLEQTFKEKGFLIQTQQLESAEGATYCKFRQLRKFTRYLFRSWKDYLPGNVGENPDGVPVPPELNNERLPQEIDQNDDLSLIGDHESVSNLSSPRMAENTSPPL